MRQLVPDDLRYEFESNCEYYRQQIERHLAMRVYDKRRFDDICDDICQTTFERALKKFKSQDVDLPQTADHLENWLCIIADRIAIDKYRRTEKIGFICLPEDDAYPSFPGLGVEEEAGIIYGLDFRKDLAQLPPRHQKVVQLIDQGLNQREIAEQLGKSPSTVSEILRDIRTQLQPKYFPVPVDIRRMEVTYLQREFNRINRSLNASAPPTWIGINGIPGVVGIPVLGDERRDEKMVRLLNWHVKKLSDIAKNMVKYDTEVASLFSPSKELEELVVIIVMRKLNAEEYIT